MPRYIDEPKQSTAPGLDEQRDQFAAFAAKLKAAKGQR